MRQYRKHYSFIYFIGILAVLCFIVWVAFNAFKQAQLGNRDGIIRSDLLTIRQEANIISDGNSYQVVCRDDNNTGLGTPVGIALRNKIDRLTKEIIDNSPNGGGEIGAVCSVNPEGDLIAFFSLTSQGYWCVDTKGFNGFGSAEPFSGVCR